MAEMHALADHEVMRACLAGVDQRRLDKESAIKVIADDPGWLPVAIEPEKRLIYFVNAGQNRLANWQFVYSIDALAREDPSLRYFSVSMDLLHEFDVETVS